MIERGEVTRTVKVIRFLCDEEGCGVVLETDTDNFLQALKIAEKKKWTAFKVDGEWQNRCPSCGIKEGKSRRASFLRDHGALGEGARLTREFDARVDRD